MYGVKFLRVLWGHFYVVILLVLCMTEEKKYGFFFFFPSIQFHSSVFGINVFVVGWFSFRRMQRTEWLMEPSPILNF